MDRGQIWAADIDLGVLSGEIVTLEVLRLSGLTQERAKTGPGS